MADLETRQNIVSPGKLPPQDLEAEMSVLGSLMVDKDAITKVLDFLEPRDFYRPIHRDVYEAAQTLFEKGEPIDLLSIASALKAPPGARLCPAVVLLTSQDPKQIG